MDDEQQFETTKRTVLKHIESMFEELEEEMALSHQEKYALLEDAFENATDVDELRVAFAQWYNEHTQELELEHELEELWSQALSSAEEE